MNKISSLFLLLTLSAAMLTSCLDSSENYTPTVLLYGLPMTTQGDTLNITADKEGKPVLDTIYMGDTVHLVVVYDSYANNLVAAHADWDTAMIDINTVVGEKILPALKPSSDTTSLHFNFVDNSGFNGLGMNLFMLPKKTGKSLVSFYVESDAQDLTNNSSISFSVVAVKRPEPTEE